MEPAAPRFLVDGMAVRLGKYLRCVGCDATWRPDLPTRLLARLAEIEGRILLTRNTRVGGEIVPPARWRLLASDDPVRQLADVARAYGLDCAKALFTRCIRCNVELEPAQAADVEARVLACVRSRHSEFFRCPRCATVFWRGSHVANTCRKLGLDPPPGTRGSAPSP